MLSWNSKFLIFYFVIFSYFPPQNTIKSFILNLRINWKQLNFHIILGLKLFIYYLNQTRCVSISEAMERSELGSERLEKY